jgi:hypothetical protein
MDDIELAVKAELDRQAQRWIPRVDSWQAFQQRAGARSRRRHWVGPALAVGFVAVIAVIVGLTLWPTRDSTREFTAAATVDPTSCARHVLYSQVLMHPGIGHGQLLLSLAGLDDGGAGICLTYQQNSSLTALHARPGILGADVISFQAEAETEGRIPAGGWLVGGVSPQTSQLKALGPDAARLAPSLARSLISVAGYRVFAISLPPQTNLRTIRLQALASDGSVLETVNVTASTIPKR